MSCLCAHFDCNQLIQWCCWIWAAPSNQIRPWSADQILENIGQETCSDDRDGKAESGDMCFVDVWTEDKIPEAKDACRYYRCVNEQHDWQSVGVTVSAECTHKLAPSQLPREDVASDNRSA